jgi:ubiquinone/menaquinone biosynthesis C-methylase UbiE
MTKRKDRSSEDIRAWNKTAASWADFVRSDKDYYAGYVHGPALMRRVGHVDDLRVLDLGCGEGRWSRVLADKGASVVGVDGSADMIRFAIESERDDRLGIEYKRADLRKLPFEDESFDLVVSAMVLMDVADLVGVLREARRVLQCDGRLVASVTHPIMGVNRSDWLRIRDEKIGRLIRDYFREGRERLDWGMRRLDTPFSTYTYHRTLSTVFSSFVKAGFMVTALDEVRPTAAAARECPDVADALIAPFFIVFEAVPKTGEKNPRR